MNWTQFKNRINSDIEIVDREDPNGFRYQAFENFPEHIQLTEKDKGNKVWIASLPRTTDAFLKKITEDGIYIKFKGEVPIRVFYSDEVLVHPDLWTKKRLDYKHELNTRFG